MNEPTDIVCVASTPNRDVASSDDASMPNRDVTGHPDISTECGGFDSRYC